MSEPKVEVVLTYEEFKKKYPKVVEFKQLDAVNYRKLITLKTFQEQVKDFGFSDSWNKELSDKFEETKPLAEQELKKASENIDTYIEELVKTTFEFHKPVIETPSEDELHNYAVQVRKVVSLGTSLDSEYIFNLIKVLFID